ncbi:hypothetical protein NIES3974_41020 [Calothrix sp. NIES-3974]|nr:hypothetical protein NIES3974_41020 [Calothrix sp. NIES-3974]
MAMLSSQDNSAYIQNQGQNSSPLNSEFDWNSQERRAEIFRLIEVYLCFEACLYHQILPLTVEDETLILGMVNPQDGAALEYASRILAYVNRTVSIYVITAEQHRELLSAYLNFKNSVQVPPTSTEVSPQNELEPEQSPPTTPSTLIAEYEFPQQLPEPSPTAVNTNPSLNTHIPLQTLTNLEAAINPKKIEDLPILCIPHPDDLNPLGLLPTLPPKQFLAELIARVINRGIGRLYFERLPYKGRILWSENGVLQSVLEKLPLSVFQGGLNELKRFAKLPLQTIAEPKQVEREYLYQQQRLMVRIRVMPGMYGEEATLQVLRGAALKFYQQQQLAKLSNNALGISQQLSHKLHELQARMLKNPNVSPDQIEALSVLNRLLYNLDNQIENFTDEAKK